MFRKGIPLIAVLLFLTVSFALAADTRSKNIRGKVETVDVKKKVFVVNESNYFWNHTTVFSDEKGIPVKIDQLKPKASVYIQWESVKGSRKRIARKVCIYNEQG
jgi:hypothetical protein